MSVDLKKIQKVVDNSTKMWYDIYTNAYEKEEPEWSRTDLMIL